MKKFFAFILVGVLLLSCLVGCSKAEKEKGEDTPATTLTVTDEAVKTEDNVKKEPEPVTISLWILAENMEKPYVAKLFTMWEEATGNKVDVIGLPDQDETPLAKFATGDIPDVLIVKSGASR